MNQNYIGKCSNQEDTITMSPHRYSSNLIMIYIEPTNNKGKIVWCYTLEELNSVYLSEENKYRVQASRNEPIYMLSNGTYVDSSIIECMNNRNNTIKLVFDRQTEIFKSYGVSSVHDLLVSIYKAIPVSRCSVLSDLNPDCKEADFFDPNAPNEVLMDEENEDAIIEDTMGGMINTVENLFFADELSKKRERQRNQQLLDEENKVMDEVIQRDDLNRIISVKRYFKEFNEEIDDNIILRPRFTVFYSNINKPSEEYYDYSTEPLTITKIWRNQEGNKHRVSAPAYIVSKGDIIIREEWFIDGFRDREDNGPDIIDRYYPSGNITVERWNERKYIVRNDDEKGTPNFRVSPLSRGAHKIEVWYANGNIAFIKDRNVLRLYDDVKNNYCYCKITCVENTIECIHIAGKHINEPILRVIKESVSTILDKQNLYKKINQSYERTTLYNYDNNACRVRKHFLMNPAENKNNDENIYTRLVLNNTASDSPAVNIYSADNILTESVSYHAGVISNAIVDEEQTPAVHVYSNKSGNLTYSVSLNPNVDWILTTMYNYTVGNILSCTKKTSPDGKLIYIDRYCPQQLKSFNFDSHKITMRDKMDNEYVYHEHKLWHALQLIKKDWNSVDAKSISNFVKLIREDENYWERILNNCAEYKTNLYSESINLETKTRESKGPDSEFLRQMEYNNYYSKLIDESKDDNSYQGVDIFQYEDDIGDVNSDIWSEWAEDYNYAERGGNNNPNVEVKNIFENELIIDFNDSEMQNENRNPVEREGENIIEIEEKLNQVRDIPLFYQDGNPFGPVPGTGVVIEELSDRSDNESESESNEDVDMIG